MDVRSMHGQEQDKTAYWDELGDLRFAVAVLVKSFGVTEEMIEEQNRHKLLLRGDDATYLAKKESR